MTFDDEKYKSLRNTLKSSARIKAKGDFDARLFERIREAEKSAFKSDAFNSQPQVVRLAKPKKGFAEVLAGMFKPAFIPALGLTMVLLVAVVVYFGYFSKISDIDEEKSLSSYQTPGDLIIYIKGEASDSFSSNYPNEYSAITENESGIDDLRSTTAPTDAPSDYFAPELSRPGTEKEPVRMDKVSEEQRFEMQKDFKTGTDGIDIKGERKLDDGIMKKESKISPKKESKVESEKSPYNIRDEKSNKNIDNDDESGQVKQQVTPEIKANEQTEDTGEKNHDKSRISRAVKDSSKTKNETDDSNETIQQK